MRDKLLILGVLGVALGLTLVLTAEPAMAGKGGGGGKPPKGGGDETPPAAVTDLTVDAFTEDTVTLSWTATGDDGMEGTASSYDIRHSTSPIDDGNWGGAFQSWERVPTPQPPGSLETYTLYGLLPDTTYYIRLRVKDEVPNASDLSIEVSATTDLGSWSIEIVDSMVNRVVLAYDPFDQSPSIGYQSSGTAKFAKWNTSTQSWDIETVGPGGGESFDFAYDPDGNPSMAYPDGKTLMFARRNSATGTWDTEEVEGTGHPDSGATLAFDPVDGNPSVSYTARRGNNLRLKFAHFNGLSWDIETVEIATVAYTSLAYDPVTGYPAIGYGSDLDGDWRLDALKFASFNGASWDIEIVESGTVGMGIQVQLRYDPLTGFPAMVHRYLCNNGDVTGPVRFARWNGASWDIEIVDDSCLCAEGPSLAFDSSGTPHVSYYIRAQCVPNKTDRSVRVAHRVVDPVTGEIDWPHDKVQSGWWRDNTSLAFDPAGLRTVAYRDGYTGELLFAKER